jgi:hypothetical protein
MSDHGARYGRLRPLPHWCLLRWVRLAGRSWPVCHWALWSHPTPTLRLKTAMSRKGPLKGPHRRAPKHGPYAGATTCLRCDREFHSWDRRQNRLCPRCQQELEREPSEEPTRPLPWAVRRSQLIEDA